MFLMIRCLETEYRLHLSYRFEVVPNHAGDIRKEVHKENPWEELELSVDVQGVPQNMTVGK